MLLKKKLEVCQNVIEALDGPPGVKVIIDDIFVTGTTTKEHNCTLKDMVGQ